MGYENTKPFTYLEHRLVGHVDAHDDEGKRVPGVVNTNPAGSPPNTPRFTLGTVARTGWLRPGGSSEEAHWNTVVSFAQGSQFEGELTSGCDYYSPG